MEAKKLDSIAAKIRTRRRELCRRTVFSERAAARHLRHYSAPQLMEPRLAGKQYRDTYMELSGTVTPDHEDFRAGHG